MYLAVVIPTYNERENIVELLDRLKATLEGLDIGYKIIVVDDNSPDGTADAVRHWCMENRDVHVDLVVRKNKRGIGSAMLDGLRKALRDSGADLFVTMDADLSHRPEDLVHMLKRAMEADVVIGSRYVEGGRILGWSMLRRIISKTANTIVRILYRTNIGDNTSNYRVYSRRAVEKIIQYADAENYEWAIQSLLIPLACGMKAVETPITFINRRKGKSKLTPRETLHWLIQIIKFKKKYDKIKQTCRT